MVRRWKDNRRRNRTDCKQPNRRCSPQVAGRHRAYSELTNVESFSVTLKRGWHTESTEEDSPGILEFMGHR